LTQHRITFDSGGFVFTTIILHVKSLLFGKEI
jgi:hypothetical protein